jgi:hypothetical protein
MLVMVLAMVAVVVVAVVEIATTGPSDTSTGYL